MMRTRRCVAALLLAATLTLMVGRDIVGPVSAAPQAKKPNIIMIMGDDVGAWNISAYHRGMMGGSTPNIDRRLV